MSDKSGLWEGIGYFFIFAGMALVLFSLGWCAAGYPGLNHNKIDNQEIHSTENSE